jgi:hypothetical protein
LRAESEMVVPEVTEAPMAAAIGAGAATSAAAAVTRTTDRATGFGCRGRYEMLSRFSGAEWSAPPHVWFAAAEQWGFNAARQARVLRSGIAARAALPPNTFLTVNVDPHLLLDEEVAGAAPAHSLEPMKTS